MLKWFVQTCWISNLQIRSNHELCPSLPFAGRVAIGIARWWRIAGGRPIPDARTHPAETHRWTVGTNLMHLDIAKKKCTMCHEVVGRKAFNCAACWQRKPIKCLYKSLKSFSGVPGVLWIVLFICSCSWFPNNSFRFRSLVSQWELPNLAFRLILEPLLDHNPTSRGSESLTPGAGSHATVPLFCPGYGYGLFDLWRRTTSQSFCSTSAWQVFHDAQHPYTPTSSATKTSHPDETSLHPFRHLDPLGRVGHGLNMQTSGPVETG